MQCAYNAQQIDVKYRYNNTFTSSIITTLYMDKFQLIFVAPVIDIENALCTVLTSNSLLNNVWYLEARYPVGQQTNTDAPSSIQRVIMLWRHADFPKVYKNKMTFSVFHLIQYDLVPIHYYIPVPGPPVSEKKFRITLSSDTSSIYVVDSCFSIFCITSLTNIAWSMDIEESFILLYSIWKQLIT